MGLGSLSAFACGAAGVAVVYARRFEHVQPEAFVFGVRGDDFSWAEWADSIVESVGVEIQGQSIRKSSAWDGYVEILEELVGLIPGVVHNMPAIRHLTTHNHTNAAVDIEDASVGFLH